MYITVLYITVLAGRRLATLWAGSSCRRCWLSPAPGRNRTHVRKSGRPLVGLCKVAAEALILPQSRDTLG